MRAGFHHLPRFLSPEQQVTAIALAREICRMAPLRHPRMPTGTPLSVKVTNAGPLGWWSDERGGYRYTDRQPNGWPWPPMPEWFQFVAASALAAVGHRPIEFETCAINWYDPNAKLGLHVDRSEGDLDAPIVSISVGDDAEFRMGGASRDDEVEVYHLQSGDVCVQGVPSRLWYHQVARIMPSPLTSPLQTRGRLNFTVRKVLA